tara:strand:- start:163 stop:432 length:270 start_codon:yes stop_codon:yes gene_type:complete
MKKLPTKFILTALAFAGGILITRYLRKMRDNKSQIQSTITNLQPPNEGNNPVFNDIPESQNSSSVSGTSDIILDGMNEEQASNLLEELK